MISTFGDGAHRMDADRRKRRVALLSVISNTTLVVLKLAVGLAISSVSVISEAIHSGVDLIAAAIAYYSVRTSGIPADREHPFGHGKIENISGTVEAILIFLAAGWIIFEAAQKIVRPEPLEMAAWGVAVMLLSAVVNTFVSRKLFRVGKETDSVALMADGWHLRTDVYTSAGVMAALAVIWAADFLAPDVDLHWVDPAAAIGVALLIIKAAWDLTRQSARDLLDVQLPGEEIAWIESLILQRKPVVKGYHQLQNPEVREFPFRRVSHHGGCADDRRGLPSHHAGVRPGDPGALPGRERHHPHRALRRVLQRAMPGGMPADGGGAKRRRSQGC